MNWQTAEVLKKRQGFYMSEAYAKERIELFEALLKKKLDVLGGKLWAIEPRHMRFKLGESIAELKIPFHMGADDESCIENSVLSLLSLLMKRYDSAPQPQSQPQDGFKEGASQQPPPINIPSLKDKTYRTDIFITGSLEKRLTEEILSCTPYMDSSMLLVWFGPEGHGRKLIRWVSEIFEKTLKEEAKCCGEEKTSYIALLAILNTIKKKKEKIKGYRIKGLSYERLDVAIGMTLFLTFRGALKETFSRIKASRASYYSYHAELLLTSAITPRQFVSIPSAIISSNLNPYGINTEAYELLAPFADGLDSYSEGVGELIMHTAEKAKGSDIIEALKQQADVIRFRQESIRYLNEFDLPGNEPRETIYSLMGDDRHVKAFIADGRAIAGLAKSLEELKERFAKDEAKSEVIESFLKFLSSFKKSVFSGFLKSVKKEEYEAIDEMVEGLYALMFDEQAERFSSISRSYLTDRRGEYSPNMILDEYNRGRLYRFSTDDRPFLKTLAVEEEGQLFIDMKDFTKKTLKVKEIAMAEFMKEYFYQPILRAAANYRVGRGVVADERGIRLTNLPGDAAIFSGGVTYLVALAKDIQKIIRNYREQLLKRLPPAKDEVILDEVHKRFEARKEELKLRRSELNAALERKEHGVESKLVALGEEEHRLENSYRSELETAIQGELEAGLYISYGTKAEEMVIEAHEEFTEPVRVSIGEKINEAARGTNRNPLVRAKIEMLLENEKQKKSQDKRYPFDVYIDRTYSIKMPPELDSAFEKLVAKRTAVTAQAMSQVIANEFLNDLKKIIAGETFTSLRLISSATDIYNKGQALSENALNAYMRENRGTSMFFKKVVAEGELDSSIRETFFFPSGQLEFWLGVSVVKGVEQVEGFYRCGEIIFKGFEASTPIPVYEILNPESDFFKALVRCHVRAWAEEAKKAEEEEAARNSI